jgi:glycosyltransferase involved in cell wall biosynthesis
LNSLKLLHIISGVWEHTGGPSESLPGLCTALVDEGCEVTLAALDGPMANSVWECQASGVKVQLFKPNFRHTIWYSSDLSRQLPALAQCVDVIHVHGLWEYPMWVGGQVARKFNIPLVMSPRGSLNPLALTRSRWKKKLVGSVFDDKNLKAASCLHATANAEYLGFRRYGLTNPVAVIPNAVNSVNIDGVSKNIVLELFPELIGKRILLFLSRINPTKGLIDLAKAWGEVASKNPDWHLVIAGPDERGHLAEVQKAFAENGVVGQVSFTGPLYGRNRESVLASADLFILPTHTENFGIAIAEALSAGIPVITTHGAPWEGLKTHDCGWWVPIGKDGLVSALLEALTIPEGALRDMGCHGKVWTEESFTWAAAAKSMMAVYRWLLNQNQPPGCVRFD